MENDDSRLVTKHFYDYDNYPNNTILPLVIFKNPLQLVDVTPEHFERSFSDHGWPAAWRNGIFDFHHYHSTAHEVLGVYSGWVRAIFGGPKGEILVAEKGDVIIIPAGVAHCNKGQSPDFKVVGAYPAGQPWDMKYCKEGERPRADNNILQVSMPLSDPIFGQNGPLMKLWS